MRHRPYQYIYDCFLKPFQSEVSFFKRAICSKVNMMLNIFQGIKTSKKVVFSLLKKC